ncbi:hypothetical protein PF005_g9380 [Phytophthora fragariae]|uniref:Uncharacterized protein n=1 Tax=Phytophthora fragariae TaxID=53985 RepID=A0A6A3YBV7_9STRA|nr:hypothetical protein PF004_g25268 [Phytophthora fragariae]KAE9205662.1 hypothetical protein PF002_g20256 [Phytophthora fragariae]KAE9215620.1 hypothetical protein PF005_g9380 [Phytophthora fragariae]
MGEAPISPRCMHADQPHSRIWRVGDKPDVTTSSRRPSPASSGNSTTSPPPAASMGTTASSKLGPAQAQPS